MIAKGIHPEPAQAHWFLKVWPIAEIMNRREAVAIRRPDDLAGGEVHSEGLNPLKPPPPGTVSLRLAGNPGTPPQKPAGQRILQKRF